MRRGAAVATLTANGATRRNARRDDRNDRLVRDRHAVHRQVVAQAETEEGPLDPVSAG
jgi:hypothetical protein